MKVTLVQTPYWSIATPPYSVALLTGNLRSRGIETFQKGFDAAFYHAVDPELRKYWQGENTQFWNDKQSVERLIQDHYSVLARMVDEILADEPDVVGFSVKVWSLWFSEAMARLVKQQAPGTRVVFGGPQMSEGDPRSYLLTHPEVDAICRREADISFPAFLEKLESSGGAFCPEPGFIYRTPAGQIVDCGMIREIPRPETIPFADYRDYDFSQYLNPRGITMVLSRGCINRCSYCSEAPHFLSFRAYPAQRVFEEICHHWEQSRCGRPMKIFFNDSLLNGNMRELEKLADLLIAHRDRIQVEYGGMMFIRKELTEEVVSKLARSGLNEVLFGLESGSPAVLQSMKKRFTLDVAERVFKAFHDAGVAVTASVIFGHPGETEAEFYKSLSFLRVNAFHIDKFLLNYLGLYGQSDLATQPEKFGIDPSTIDHLNRWVADEGRNTFEIRTQRVNVARLALGQKVADVGCFYEDGRRLYDPFSSYREQIAALSSPPGRRHQHPAWGRRLAGRALNRTADTLSAFHLRPLLGWLANNVLPRRFKRALDGLRMSAAEARTA